MMRARVLPFAVVWAAGTVACDPYERFNQNEDDSLGAVDPINFPPPNLGQDGSGNRRMSGVGTFTAKVALGGGMPVSYFDYPFPELEPDADPLAVEDVAAPAYVFDPTYTCTPPAGYTPDRRRDEVPLNQQGNIFTTLPDAHYSPETGPKSDYFPVVAEIPVPAPGFTCQQPKSEEALARISGIKPEGRMPSGRYLAYLIIDPGAAVYPAGASEDTHTGLGLQSWGWYNRYLLAYLDGGEIPTRVEMVGAAPMPMMVRRMVTQKLYYPRSMVVGEKAGMPTMAPGALGAGLDVMEFKRGTPGYSPVCEVFSYDAGTPRAPADLPKTPAEVDGLFAATLMPDSPRFVFCLQGATP
jgi:hypothetical protein